MENNLREKALSLPMKPGVYIMKDKNGEVIYVGKAKLLKNRVSSYFHGAHNSKTEAMISKIDDFSFIVASSEFEALVLENSLIKHHMPHYNILLKDDKGYPFVRLDVKSEYPVFTLSNNRADDGALYFGPFGGRSVTRAAIDAVRKAFKLPLCSKKFPRDIGKERPCLNYHMGLCKGYCREEANPKEYRAAIDKAVMVMQGRTDELVSALKEEMNTAAEELRFEDAANIRDAVNAVLKLRVKQNVLAKASADTDAAALYRGEGKNCFAVLHYVGGQLLAKDSELVEDSAEESGEALSLLVRRYYENTGSIPKNIYLYENTGDMDELSRYFSESAGTAVKVMSSKSGKGREYADAAYENAREDAEIATTAEERISKTEKWIEDALHISAPPKRIEAYDISNLGASNIVASMVVFEHGKPKKNQYRKFKIKTTDGQDDYGSMQEVVGRRFANYNEADEKFAELPDLVLIDGGAGQTAAAKAAMDKQGVTVPVFGMVKDDRHRTRALINADGGEIGLAAYPGAFAFIGRIQEEAHRFAIDFHRSLRSKSTVKSKLDGIDGVGEKRKSDLLRKFKSIKAISDVSVQELSEVVPKNIADKIYKHFHTESGEEKQ